MPAWKQPTAKYSWLCRNDSIIISKARLMSAENPCRVQVYFIFCLLVLLQSVLVFSSSVCVKLPIECFLTM